MSIVRTDDGRQVPTEWLSKTQLLVAITDTLGIDSYEPFEWDDPKGRGRQLTEPETIALADALGIDDLADREYVGVRMAVGERCGFEFDRPRNANHSRGQTRAFRLAELREIYREVVLS